MRAWKTPRANDFLKERVCEVFNIGHFVNHNTFKNMVWGVYLNLNLYCRPPVGKELEEFLAKIHKAGSYRFWSSSFLTAILWSEDPWDAFKGEFGGQRRLALCNFFCIITHSWWQPLCSLQALLIIIKKLLAPFLFVLWKLLMLILLQSKEYDDRSSIVVCCKTFTR